MMALAFKNLLRSDSLKVAAQVHIGIPYLNNVKVRQSTFKQNDEGDL